VTVTVAVAVAVAVAVWVIVAVADWVTVAVVVAVVVAVEAGAPDVGVDESLLPTITAAATPPTINPTRSPTSAGTQPLWPCRDGEVDDVAVVEGVDVFDVVPVGDGVTAGMTAVLSAASSGVAGCRCSVQAVPSQ
jgi:hypothetical protein